MENFDNQIVEENVQTTPNATHSFNDNEKDLMTQACAYIYSMSKWMRFFFVLMILGIVFMGVLGLIFTFGGSAFNSLYSEDFDFPFIIFGLIYIACAGVYVIPAIYMKRIYKAADQTLISNDNAAMVEFLKNNKSLWKFSGIFVIVMFCLCITVFPLIGALVGLANL